MFGISWLACALLAAGFAAIAFAILVPHRSAEADDAMQVDAPCDVGPPDDPVVQEEISAPRPPAITWPSLIDGSQEELPLGSRLRLIEGLGSLGEPWCGPVLVSAYFEEEESAAREAVLRALLEARYSDCDSVLKAALQAPRVSERILAVDVADAIDASAALDDALADSDLSVGTAAVYALKKRFNGSLLAHIELHVSRDRAATLLNAIRVLS